MEEAPALVDKVDLGDEVVVLDTSLMKFNEASLSDFLQKVYSWVAYFGHKLAKAEAMLAAHERRYDVIYAEKFIHFKDSGGTEKLSESKAKAHSEVAEAKRKVGDAKYAVRLLHNHIRAWEMANSNAQNRGHTLRKEMGALNNTIYESEREVSGGIDSYVADAAQALKEFKGES